MTTDDIKKIKILQAELLRRLEKAETDIDDLRKESATFQARKDILEEWLTEYRDELKKTNVFRKNQALIKEINELLNWPL
jgi:erythromycin esterase-like protein